MELEQAYNYRSGPEAFYEAMRELALYVYRITAPLDIPEGADVSEDIRIGYVGCQVAMQARAQLAGIIKQNYEEPNTTTESTGATDEESVQPENVV